ncbi:hypothetical protein AB0M36_23940 [Actinoplanes sp. NPDC051346]|uniref:hypothetical protein n=1 Tax=Actinoplanes sp. NPDC051346 TaxID=3155048 RepID=UPI00343B6CAB
MQTAITTVEHCLGLWHSFIAAATNHPLHIAVTTPDDPDSDTAPAVSAHLDTDQGHLHLQVPRSLVDEPPSRLAARILDVVVPAIVVHAENHPHEQPPAFWVSTQAWQPPADEPEPGIRLEDLLDGDALLIARHDGTPAGADSRERTLDDYLCEQLESPGIAVRDGALTTDTTLSWTLELLNSD